jgi:integrase
MTMTRRYQQGTIECIKTAAGLCWYIRFTAEDGKRPRFRIGLKADLPNEARASRAAQPLRDRFNQSAIVVAAAPRTFADVIARYEVEEMSKRHSTRTGELKMHRNYLRPAWGALQIERIDAMEVRAWLRDLKGKKGQPLSSRSKGHLHNQMKKILKFAMLWKWMPAQINPMSLFSLEGATKRTRAPKVISPAQFRELLAYFRDDRRMHCLVVGAYCLGLRSSELFGLKWMDFDHLGATVQVRRAVVKGHEGEVKTERSNAPLPLAKFVGDTFLRWRQSSDLREDEDWVFASPYNGGKMPIDANNLQRQDLTKAGKHIGLSFALGWHTLRHSYKSLLDRVSADASLKRDLMRHADVHTTMQTYGEVEMDRLRVANDAAVALALIDS